MSQIAINTSQNVNINFNIASIGERFLAFIIDNVIMAVYAFLILYLFFGVFNLGYVLDGLDYWSEGAD